MEKNLFEELLKGGTRPSTKSKVAIGLEFGARLDPKDIRPQEARNLLQSITAAINGPLPAGSIELPPKESDQNPD